MRIGGFKTLSIVKEVNDFYLRNELWSGAIDTFNIIAENNKIYELMDLLEELYPDPVYITTINDLLWFEDDWILEQLGIDSEDE